MSVEPCIPSPIPASTAGLPPHRLSHHIGSRHLHRLRRVHAATSAPPPVSCGKQFAAGQPGGLAARPTDGVASAGGAAKGPILAKLAAGGAASLLGAAAVAGTTAIPAGYTTPAYGVPSGGGSPVGGGLSVPGASSGHIATQAGGVQVTPSPAGQVATPIPEPSSLLVLLGAATLALVLRARRKLR